MRSFQQIFQDHKRISQIQIQTLRYNLVFLSANGFFLARSTSWRGEGDTDEKSALPERGSRSSWNDTTRLPPGRKSWDTDDHLPEWATENPTDGGGSFDEKGAFHGSDDEQVKHCCLPPTNLSKLTVMLNFQLDTKSSIKREIGLQKSVSQQHIAARTQPHPLSSSKSTISLVKPEDSSKKKEQQPKETEEVVHKKESESDNAIERNKSSPNIPEKNEKQDGDKERAKSEGPSKVSEKQSAITNGPVPENLK